MEFEVAKLGERGQVVIPQEFRETMNLQKGDKFIVIEHGDALIFKRIKEPSLKEFEDMIKKGHEHARKHKLTEDDLHKAIQNARAHA